MGEVRRASSQLQFYKTGNGTERVDSVSGLNALVVRPVEVLSATYQIHNHRVGKQVPPLGVERRVYGRK